MILATRIKKKVLMMLFMVLFPYYYISAQNNPYKIKDNLYEYFIRCQQLIKEKKVLTMSDTLFCRAKRENDLKAQCLALILKGDYYYYNNDIENLKIWKERLGNFAKKTPYTQYVFGIWGRVINYYVKKDLFNEALKETELYQKEAIKINSTYGIGSSYNRLGNLYIMNSNSRLALNEFFKALDYYKKNGEEQELYNIYANIANAYNMMPDYEQAAVYWEKALGTAPDMPSSKGLFYVNLAYDYLKTGKVEEALKNIKLLEDWKKKYNLFGVDKENYYRTYIFYMEYLKDYEKALLYCDSLKDQIGLYYKSSLYYKMGKYKKAFDTQEEYLKNKSIKEAEKGNETIAKYSALFENERVKNEKNLLEIKNNRLEIEQLKAIEKLLASEKDRNNLLLANTKLELNNKKLDLQTQKAETDRQKANMRQLIEKHNLDTQKTRNKNIINASLISFLIIFSISLLALTKISHRASVRLKGKRLRDSTLAEKEKRLIGLIH